MGLFGFGKKKKKGEQAPPKPALVRWQGNSKSGYFRLIHIIPKKAGLSGKAGIFLIWHQGVQPNWVYIGASADVGAAMDKAKDDKRLMEFEKRGGLYMVWAPFKEEFWSGVVLYLRDRLNPEVESCSVDFKMNEKAKFIPVIPPFALHEGE